MLSNLLLKTFTESSHMTLLGKVFHVLMTQLQKEFKHTNLLARSLINLYRQPTYFRGVPVYEPQVISDFSCISWCKWRHNF